MGRGEVGHFNPFHPSLGCVCVGGGCDCHLFPFDQSPSSFPQLDARRPSHKPAAGLVSQSGTCMITNSWINKMRWAAGARVAVVKATGPKAVEEGRERRRRAAWTKGLP